MWCVSTHSHSHWWEKIRVKELKKKKRFDAPFKVIVMEEPNASRSGPGFHRFLLAPSLHTHTHTHTHSADCKWPSSVSASAETYSLVSVCLVCWMPKWRLISPWENRTLMGFYYWNNSNNICSLSKKKTKENTVKIGSFQSYKWQNVLKCWPIIVEADVIHKLPEPFWKAKKKKK